MNTMWARLTRRSDGPPRTPSLRQIQQTECGVIALAIILAHYGAWIPLMDLRRRCEVSEQGVTALSLVQTGKHYGLAIRAMRLRVDDLQHVQAPVILFWEHWHFLVLEGIRGDTVWVNDPARGHRKLTLAALRSGYSGVALIAQPGPEFRSVGSPGQPFRTTIATLRPGRWWLILMGAAALGESVLLPLVVLLAGNAIGDAWGGKAGDWRSVGLALVGLLVAGASRLWLTGVALGAIAGPARQRLTLALADESSDNRLRQHPALVGRHELADYPAATAVRIVTAGMRMFVAVPLLIVILGRLHPVGALVALAALAAWFLMQQQTTRAAAGAHPTDVRSDGSRWQRPGRWWPILRPFVELSPVIAVGVLTPTETLPAILVALLATWFAFRLVDSAVQATSMLYLLPESAVQLSDIDRKLGVAEHAG
jgi:hypothetical protein